MYLIISRIEVDLLPVVQTVKSGVSGFVDLSPNLGVF